MIKSFFERLFCKHSWKTTIHKVHDSYRHPHTRYLAESTCQKCGARSRII